MNEFRQSYLAAAAAGLLWIGIPLADTVLPWGRSGNRAYGYYDLVLFVGPLLMAGSLPELFRLYANKTSREATGARWVTTGGSLLLILGAFGWGYGDLLVGVGLASPLLLLALLIMSVGLVLLGISTIRGSRWSWEAWAPVVAGGVPFVWLITVLVAGLILSDDAAFSTFFERSFTGLIISVGSGWLLQAFALASVLRDRHAQANGHAA